LNHPYFSLNLTHHENDQNPPARIISRKQVFKRFFSLDVIEAEPRSLKHEGYALKIEREVMDVGGVVVILLYCPETDEILLNQQFRMGCLLRARKTLFCLNARRALLTRAKTPNRRRGAKRWRKLAAR